MSSGKEHNKNKPQDLAAARLLSTSMCTLSFQFIVEQWLIEAVASGEMAEARKCEKR